MDKVLLGEIDIYRFLKPKCTNKDRDLQMLVSNLIPQVDPHVKKGSAKVSRKKTLNEGNIAKGTHPFSTKAVQNPVKEILNNVGTQDRRRFDPCVSCRDAALIYLLARTGHSPTLCCGR